MAEGCNSSSTMNWDLYVPNWKSYLEGLKPCKSSEVHKCPLPSPNTYIDVENYEDMKDFEVHAAHVMLYCPAKESDLIIGKYPLQYRIVMQIRFDGKLGFPGGEIDEIDNFTFTPDNYKDFMEVIKQGLVREVQEEMEIELKSDLKHILSSVPRVVHYPKSILHFFAAKIPTESMDLMENKLPDILSNDEVLGITRVPLYIIQDERGLRGLPTFMTNAFAGNCVEQLMKACIVEKLLSEDQVRVAYHLASCLMKKTIANENV